MIRTLKLMLSACVFISLLFQPLLAGDIEEGKKLGFDRKKGNCLACHAVDGGSLAGNTGPMLIAMKARFPDRDTLIAQISDPRKNNPQTIMPPFGSHDILSDVEINKIVTWLYSL